MNPTLIYRSLAKAEAEVDALEARCAEAEETEAHLQRDLRAAEAAAGGREDLEAHVVALQERLEETRAERGQLANYKQVRGDPYLTQQASGSCQMKMQTKRGSSIT